MAQIEKSTISVPTAATVLVAVVGLVIQFFATRYAVQLEIQEVGNKVQLEAKEREKQDAILDQRITQNKEEIHAINTRVEALRPSTVTTFR
jgi:cell division protein FtsL